MKRTDEITMLEQEISEAKRMSCISHDDDFCKGLKNIIRQREKRLAKLKERVS